METMYYVGLDVHKKKISYCVKDVSGRIHLEGAIAATRIDLDRARQTKGGPNRGASRLFGDQVCHTISCVSVKARTDHDA